MRLPKDFSLVLVFVVATFLFGPASASPQEDLFAAAARGDPSGIKIAIRAKADVNMRDTDGWTSLLIAVTAGKSLEAVKVLLDAGADTTAANNKGETPLMGAALRGNEDMVRLLLAKGADKATQNQNGLNAAEFARRKGHERIAALLRVGPPEAARIPPLPIGDPKNIQLTNGLSLQDWIGTAERRIGSSEFESVLAEGGRHLQQYGPHRSLMQVLDRASIALAGRFRVENAAQAREALPHLEQAIAGGEWPPVLAELGGTYYYLARYKESAEMYGRWLMATPPDHPSRQKMIDFMLKVRGMSTPSQSRGSTRAGQTTKDCTDCPEMVVIPAGSFQMGSNNDDGDEKPVHSVRIPRAFVIGKTEVTQGQWRAVMGNNPSHFSSCGDDCPVEQVSWNDAQAYLKKLSQKTGKTYRLPSEAEWEYACRAGGTHIYCGSDNSDSVARYDSNSGGKTRSVAGKQPNAWGLYDMSGNVYEWTEDCGNGSYNGAPDDGSAWSSGDCGQRVVRGGSWNNKPQFTRAAYRGGLGISTRNRYLGFRLARMLP